MRASRKIEGNSFEFASNLPDVEVSRMETSIRQDAWARRFRVPSSLEKSSEEKVKYLHPEAFATPTSSANSVATH